MSAAVTLVNLQFVFRLSALEAVVEDGQLLNEHSTCAPQFVHAFRAIYAQLGAALARLADTVSAPKSQNEVSHLPQADLRVLTIGH